MIPMPTGVRVWLATGYRREPTALSTALPYLNRENRLWLVKRTSFNPKLHIISSLA
jgi:hypothetical protein